MVTEKSHKFYCKNCDYGCSRPAEYKRHCLTIKHKMTEIGTEKSQNVCECGKKYAHKQGLYRHKKTCNYHEKTINEHIIHKEEEFDKEEFKKEMFLYLIKENKEMKEFMMEQNDRYLNLLLNIMCYEDEVLSNHTKIMQNVIKITVINKEEYAKIK